ncbi:uncharacterized protein FPRN_05638 [Fusarium proliferatum]|nr:uncharacterized protein FPRN_05638 [Fusarium proliferatum]
MPRHALPILSMFVVPQRLQLTRNGMRGAGFANSHTVQPELIFRSRVTTFANESDWSPIHNLQQKTIQMADQGSHTAAPISGFASTTTNTKLAANEVQRSAARWVP